ncbi:Putative alpha/beta hydrolase [Fulvia fulva]|uniref:Alpha/beta hydrolase n=1 Tax=Passalora fulva TaxID=5499 RepID=A0A9Q8LA94_PASFU|nr:Putative alpha/beta hydrolase [Fulvia fulva]KAK4631831.1 putative alpha/beta hydrolase [Fulvia fulva]KAK4632560.1 putative alpha/beta hydrolase [Fulvia fulva]UJO13684.1 Putative alpha/beta hydrolase [Fulvia fulva]WPV11036.1 Putative alpha/beta hydrolase [Fulvia fulva]WPV26668.1 Putative alpha/beta hydrolase [Fulvia fulva]
MATKSGLNPNVENGLTEAVLSTTYKGPGRLGDPNMKIFQDPRAHPKIVETLRAFGMDGSQPNPYADMSLEELSSDEQMAKSHTDTSTLYEVLPNDLPGDEDEPAVEQSTQTFESYDGVERKLHVFRPASQEGDLPCVVYFHGGGMVVLDTANKIHFRWCTSLAAQGVVAIAVDFRNVWSSKGSNPFPRGLNDCASAVQYISTHKTELKVSSIVLQGESGGANLALATTLKAKREGWVDQIAGVYAMAPYISNGYGWSDTRKLEELPSLYECEGYWLYTAMMAGMSRYYSGDDSENPLAWPYYASTDDCTGLPPHILSMDELDVLRDEGMAYARKLLAAGIEVTAQVNLGVVHASALIFRKLLPEVHNKAIRDIVSFSKSL